MTLYSVSRARMKLASTAVISFKRVLALALSIKLLGMFFIQSWGRVLLAAVFNKKSGIFQLTVFINPGETLLTRMSGATARAKDLAR